MSSYKMKRIALTLLLAVSTIVVTSGTSFGAGFNSDSVMLQAWYWDCPQGWYNTIRSEASGLKSAGFTHFWFPPPCRGLGGNNSMGYDITDNYDLNTRFGGESQLRDAASACGNVLLDLVCNHMMGATGQCQDPYNGQTYWQNYSYWHGTFEKGCCDFHPGCPDDCDLCNGLDYLMGEDVCHNSSYMFNGQITWANWLRSTIGNIEGFRLDAVKHFSWNLPRDLPGTKVGEYWDNEGSIKNWINYTGCYAFDFPLHWAMQGNASQLDGAGLGSSRGVSFVGNHDSDGVSQKIRAYGFIMYIEPTPCVFWPHWFSSWGQNGIQRAITARQSNNMSGTSTIFKQTDLIMFSNNGGVYGVFNSSNNWNSGSVNLSPNTTYTAIAWGGSSDSKPSDKTSDGSGWVSLEAAGQGYAYYKASGGAPPPDPPPGEYLSNYSSVALPGSWNGWDPAGNPMTLIADYTWEGSITFSSAGSHEYKFAMNGSWSVNRGLGNSSGPDLPQSNTNLTQSGGNIAINVPADTVTFTYHENTESSEADSGAPPGEYLSDYSKVCIPGTHNGWNASGDEMTLIADYTWEGEITFGSSGSHQYKFAMDGSWSVNRGLGSSSGPNLPQDNWNLTQNGGNIAINVPSGTVVFTYYEDTEESTAVQ